MTMERIEIIGLAGPIAVGKTTLAKWLKKERGFSVYSCSETIGLMISDGIFAEQFPEIKKYIGSGSREDYLALGKELREKYGDDIIVELTIRRAIADGKKKVVIDGVRGRSEMEKIQEYGGIVVYLDAPVEVLYERFKNRKKKIDEGDKSFSRFMKLINQEEDDFGIRASRKYADVVVRNDGSFERLVKIFETL